MWLKAEEEASFVYFEGLPRQVALVGSGHRPWAGPQGRRATRADGGTGSEVSEGGGGEKAAWRWVAWLPYSLCWNLTMVSSPKAL